MSSGLIVTGGRVHTRPGQSAIAELLVVGTRVVSPREMPRESVNRIRADGASVVPLLTDTVFDSPEPPAPDSFDLAPGNPATFAVIAGTVSRAQITRMLVVRPQDLVAVVVDGQIIAVDGAATTPAGSGFLNTVDPRLGAWTDTGREMTQHLGPDGRYSETRDGRRHAYTGRFWLTGDRITYHDDSGFWAFGQFHHDVLHHAGFVLRPDTRP